MLSGEKILRWEKNNMKLLIGSDLFYPVLYTGGEVHSFNVARWLVRLGHEVTVIAAKTAFNAEDIASLKDEEEVEGIRIIRVGKHYRFGATLGSLSAMKEMYAITKRRIEQDGAEIVYPMKPRAYLPLFLASRRRAPCVAMIHDFYPRRFIGTAGWCLQQITLRLPYEYVLTVSSSVKERLGRYHAADRIGVVYNGLNLETVDTVSGAAKKTNRIVYLGNLQRHKNIMDVINTVKMARSEIDGLELVIASSGGPDEPKVKEAVNQSDFITYARMISDDEKIRLLKESSLLVLASSAEGFGLVLIEALSCRTPFIAYDIPAVREVRDLTQGGVLVQHGDWRGMARQMVLLLQDARGMEQLAENGRRAVEKEFTWEKTARRVEAAFQDALEMKNKQ